MADYRKMTESFSKWDVGRCGNNLRLPLLAVVCALSSVGVARAAAPERSAEVRSAELPPVPVSIGASLAKVSAASFEPGVDSMVQLATLNIEPRVSRLNVPAPDALSPAKPATGFIPEPGAIGFGLAVAALIFGNFAKSFVRCWKMTSTGAEREP